MNDNVKADITQYYSFMFWVHPPSAEKHICSGWVGGTFIDRFHPHNCTYNVINA